MLRYLLALLAAQCAALTMSGAALTRLVPAGAATASSKLAVGVATSPVLAPAFTIAKSSADEALDSLIVLFPAVFLVRRSSAQAHSAQASHARTQHLLHHANLRVLTGRVDRSSSSCSSRSEARSEAATHLFLTPALVSTLSYYLRANIRITNPARERQHADFSLFASPVGQPVVTLLRLDVHV